MGWVDQLIFSITIEQYHKSLGISDLIEIISFRWLKIGWTFAWELCSGSRRPQSTIGSTPRHQPLVETPSKDQLFGQISKGEKFLNFKKKNFYFYFLKYFFCLPLLATFIFSIFFHCIEAIFHPVYGAGTWTHDLLIMCLLP